MSLAYVKFDDAAHTVTLTNIRVGSRLEFREKRGGCCGVLLAGQSIRDEFFIRVVVDTSAARRSVSDMRTVHAA